MKTIVFNLCIALLIFSNKVDAQNKNLYSIGNDYTITINGTSNLHDWHETVDKALGRGIITQNTDGSFNIDSLYIRMDVHSINSPEGKTMVNKTRDALKANQYPFITFSIASPLKITTANKDGVTVNTPGELTIAGVTKHIIIQGKIYAGDAHKFIFEGTLPVMLNDYNITPPTAMLGLLKVKNAITVHYRTSFEMKS
ncbi:hypothetical protein A9P82_03420 [Arachidicoccus ginsenosidimutans]|uniref:YceI family protein n=1 Tax=Arachidicoccus sp. BS20 TaxID=1850526 RepID=UPI0007F119CF|nr:YceI family protein [Arachidicoccus sp. BS20]ANI88435.1 hypothetical protein A9P82_03420 [Arachidicoccus sp. BS20]